MKTIKSLMCASIILTSMATYAQMQPTGQSQRQKLQRSHKTVYVGESHSQLSQEKSDSLIAIFYEDQFRHAQDARAPYFLLMSRDGSIAMGIGGKLQGNLSYDFDGTIDGSDFSPYMIPVPHDPANPTRFQTGIAQTALLATVFGNSSKFGNFLLNIEGKFGGPSQTFKLKKAYITINKLTFGQVKSTFSDPAAIPSTVETMGPCGAIDDTRLLLRFIQPFKTGFSIAASIEMPHNDYNVLDGFTQSTSETMPDAAVYLQYGKPDNHIRVSGIVKSMRYRDLRQSENHYIAGYGVNLTTKYHITPSLVLYGSANYGRGIGGMVNDLGNGSLDLLSYSSTSENAGRMYAPASFSWFAGLEYHFSPSVFSTVIFSQDRLYTKADTFLSGNGFRYGMYAVANIFWEITPRIEVGAEFDWGRRVDVTGQGADAHRLALSGAFSF